MATKPLLAIAVKKTGHILGILSREIDSSGAREVQAVAPLGLRLRKRVEVKDLSAVKEVPKDVELTIPASLLEVIAIDSPNRDAIIRDPASGVVSSDGTVGTMGASGAPTLTFDQTSEGDASTFKIVLTSYAGQGGVEFFVVFEQAEPPGNSAPMRRYGSGVIDAGKKTIEGVKITNSLPLLPGTSATAPANPLPVGPSFHTAVFAAGCPMVLELRRLLKP